MALISLATSITGGNQNYSAVTIALSTNSACKLIILTLAVNGTSAINVAPALGTDYFTKVGSTVATTEGNVEMWYLNTNTANRSGFVSYSNKSSIYNVANLYTFSSTDTIILQDVDSTFSVSGKVCQLTSTFPTNTGTMTINQWHSGYPTLSGVSKSGTLLHQTDRGNLISGTAYSRSQPSSNHTDTTLHWTTPVNDDFAMIQAGFMSGTPAPVGSITSRNTIGFANITSVDTVSLSSLGTINSIDTGN
jgi:hypothetical protein|tara:strand:- start:8492 stop:9238 length:747 start_codon:yes stop_codon:yes gene_type:complete